MEKTTHGMIRTATVDDVPRIVEMSLRFIESSSYKQFIQADAEGLERLIGQVMLQGVILVGEMEAVYFEGDLEIGREQILAGMMAIASLTHPFTGEPYGDELAWWVEPEYRKGTLGHKLLCAGEHWARQNGLTVLKMVAPAGSDVGTHYVRRGFSLVETVYQKTLTE